MQSVIRKAQVATGAVLIGLGAVGCSEKEATPPGYPDPSGIDLAHESTPFVLDESPLAALSARVNDAGAVKDIARRYRADIEKGGVISLDSEQGKLLFEMLTEQEEATAQHDVDNKVALLQACLALSGRLSSSGIDGVYLEETWKAVGSSEAGLRVMSGLVSQLVPEGKIQFTDAEMVWRSDVVSPLLSRLVQDYSRPTLSYSTGRESAEIESQVTALQIILKKLGYLKSTVDGDLGTLTMEAVNEFRADHNRVSNSDNQLSITDQIGRKTLRALIRSYVFSPSTSESE